MNECMALRACTYVNGGVQWSKWSACWTSKHEVRG